LSKTERGIYYVEDVVRFRGTPATRPYGRTLTMATTT
jgi:hypothetical protein